MRINQRTKVFTTQTTGVTLFGIIAGTIVAIGFGPAAGLLVGFAGTIMGIVGVKNEARKKANNLLPNDRLLEEARKVHEKTGKKEIDFKIEYKNKNKEIPFLGRLIYGDKEVFEKTFYFKD